ncbi:MAG TPA: proton-conducting transporter membrane subunit [bacterium]|nr:proton-conducting transporter membrane subunit [bacterium]HOL47537.1 proton-conducting transporter membrane subunit [bacterium]HPQ19111.1 proton-conducting transporter membrane subunit [bacterium]
MNNFLPLFVAVPLFISFLIQLLNKLPDVIADWLALLSTLFLAIISIYLIRTNEILIYQMGGWQPPIGINLVFDSFTGVLLTIISLITCLIVIYSFSYMEKFTEKKKYYSLLLLMLSGMNGVVISGDIFNIYVFLEIASIASYALVGFGCEDEELEAAFKYLVLGSVASAFILLGIIFIYGKYGTLNLAQLATYIGNENLINKINLNMIISVLFIMGFGLKAALVPFHAWLPDAHPSAPAPISAMLSGLLIKALGIYVIIRIFFFIFKISLILSYIIMGLGMLSMFIGVLLALGQWDFKRLLAYHSISQMGYIILSFGIAGAAISKNLPSSIALLALIGGIYHLINHSVFKSLLFLCSGAIEYATGTRKIKELGGLREKMPITSLTCFIASLSISGIPPFNGFWSKLIIIIAAILSKFYFAAVITVIVSFLTLLSFIKVQKHILMGELKENLKEIKEVPISMCFSTLMLSILCISLGLFYPLVKTKFLDTAANIILNNYQYIQTIQNFFMK